MSYFRLSPESELIYAIINIASIKTRFPLIIDIRNIMWVNDKYKKKNCNLKRSSRLELQMMTKIVVFVCVNKFYCLWHRILTYLSTDLVNCCYSVFWLCLRPWGRNYPFISKDMFCNLRRFRVLGRKSFIRVFNCLAS